MVQYWMMLQKKLAERIQKELDEAKKHLKVPEAPKARLKEYFGVEELEIENNSEE